MRVRVLHLPLMKIKLSPTKIIEFPCPKTVGEGDRLWDSGWSVCVQRLFNVRYALWEIQNDIVDISDLAVSK